MAETTVTTPSYSRRLIAETFGTFLLVFGVVGAALWYNDAAKPLVVGLSVGIAVIAGAYAVGHVSGGHFNPAVSLGAAAAGRMPWSNVPGYIAAQFVGGLLAALLHFAIKLSHGDISPADTFSAVSNHYDDGFAPLVTVLILEIAITAIFLWVILGVTADGSTTPGFAPLAIGLSLALFHFIAIPLDNASLNPARSLATAVFGGPAALGDVWLFLIAPPVGALIAGLTWRPLFGRR
jgi:aquaporin Z